MFKLTLRKKLLMLSALLAVIPLAVSGGYMIRIFQDELKSYINDELLVTADQLAQQVDSLYTQSWLAPLTMMKHVLEDDNLGAREKISVLSNIGHMPDLVALQVTIQGADSPILITQNQFIEKMNGTIADPDRFLILPQEDVFALSEDDTHSNRLRIRAPQYIASLDVWLITLIFPLEPISGRKAVLSARVNLNHLRDTIQAHPFMKTGRILIIDQNGKPLFPAGKTEFNQRKSVDLVSELLHSGVRTSGVAPYTNADGYKILAGYAIPLYVDWAFIVERNADDAYLALNRMIQSLLLMAAVGLVVALVGATMFSLGISRPILEIGRVAQLVGQGDFTVRVRKIRSRDEISQLGRHMNEMIEGLRERFQLRKFVSGQTIHAIRQSQDGVKLGGERRIATVFFSDIRGFTAFSEKNAPEVVIKMLNTYLRCQAEIVRKYGGDIDKYVGDELVAVFKGRDMVRHAVWCAVEIHSAIHKLNQQHPDWQIQVGIGINTGEVIMGAMGSEERMDYTILGDTVNIGARLCDHAGPLETLISENSYRQLTRPGTHEQAIDHSGLPEIVPCEPIRVKGKTDLVKVYKIQARTEEAVHATNAKIPTA